MDLPWEAIATVLVFLVPAGTGFAFWLGSLQARLTVLEKRDHDGPINKLFSEITKLRESVARLEGILTKGQSGQRRSDEG